MTRISTYVTLTLLFLTPSTAAPAATTMSIKFDGTTADNQAFELDFTLVDSNKIFYGVGGDLIEGGTGQAALFGFTGSPFTSTVEKVGGNVIFSGTPSWGLLQLQESVYYEIDSSVWFYSDNIPDSFFTDFSTDGDGRAYYNAPNGDLETATLTHMSAINPPSGDISSVPEPSTWALMLAGFGLIGALVRVRIPLPGLHIGTRNLRKAVEVS